MRARANPPLLAIGISTLEIEIYFPDTHANPRAISPQIPALTRRGSWIFQRNITGRIERIKSVAAAIARSSQRGELLRDSQARVRTSLRNAGPIDHGIGPTMAVDLLVPVILDWSTLREYDSGVKRAGNGVECNEAPEKDCPFPVLETVRLLAGVLCAWDILTRAVSGTN